MMPMLPVNRTDRPGRSACGFVFVASRIVRLVADALGATVGAQAVGVVETLVNRRASESSIGIAPT